MRHNGRMPVSAARIIGRLHSLRDRYYRLFSVAEIESNKTLQWLFGAMLLFFFVTFYQWMSSPFTTTEVRAVCWPYFLDCNALHFLSYFPYGYSQTIFYTGLFAVMLYIVNCMYRSQWAAAHFLLLLLWLWKAFASYVLSWDISGVYDYYHLLITAVLLFAAHKEYFAKLMFVLLYFLSATIKFYPSWILGTYFTSLKLGLPLFPDSMTPLITNFVIFEQVIGCWFLLSKNRVAQRLTLAYSVLFHLYGSIFVLYNYTIMSLSTLLILFGSTYRHQLPPLGRRARVGWCIIVLAVLLQTPVHFISGDEKLTMEGYRFGVWMFDANHQCAADFTAYYSVDTNGLASSSYALPRAEAAGRGSARRCARQNTRMVNGYRTSGSNRRGLNYAVRRIPTGRDIYIFARGPASSASHSPLNMRSMAACSIASSMLRICAA
jgi:hypothetical protein